MALIRNISDFFSYCHKLNQEMKFFREDLILFQWRVIKILLTTNIPETPSIFFQKEKIKQKYIATCLIFLITKFTSYECPLHVYKSCVYIRTPDCSNNLVDEPFFCQCACLFVKLFENVFSQQTSLYQITWRIRDHNHDHSLILITINKSVSSVDFTFTSIDFI